MRFNYSFPQWLQRDTADGTGPSTAFLMLAAFVVGITAGACAQLLKWMVAQISHFALTGLDPTRWNWRFLWLPVIGVILAACYQRYVIHREISHGVDRLKAALARRHTYMPLGLTISPLIAAALTLGFWGSAGTEGPIAYASAAIGSNLAKRCRLSRSMVMTFTAIGAGAGIAAIFRAPVGGFFFTLEVIGLAMGITQLVALGVCCLTAGLTAWMLAGGVSDIPFPAWHPFDLSTIPKTVFVGAACGLYAVYYNRVMGALTARYAGFINPWLKNLTAGAVIGLSLFLLPALYGEGYGVITHVLAGDLSALSACGPLAHITASPWGPVGVCLLILLVKAVATASTTSGGGVAGDFAPAIFAGCAAGLLFASVVNLLFGLSLPVSDYACYGMAAVLGGTSRAPLMAIFLVVEMSGHYSLLMPVACAAATSYLIVTLLKKSAPHPSQSAK